MKRTFIAVDGFWEDWQHLNLNDQDINIFELYLMENLTKGDLVRGAKGIRKIRWAIGNKGKSGGVRIFYFDHESSNELFLIAVISKTEKENLTQAEINILAKLVTQLKNEG